MESGYLKGVLDFVVVGAQKSGTTWLHECFNDHPEILVPPEKEVHFFCPAGRCRYSSRNKGVDWYRSKFAKSGEFVAGESSTDYMFYDGVAEALYESNPQLKIIFLLRNPIDRAYSAYWMWRRHNTSLGPFEEVIGTYRSLLERGLYWRQIEPFVDLFGESQIRIEIYEELFEFPSKTLKSLYEWLGVDPGYESLIATKKIGNTVVYPGVVGKFVYKGLTRIINMGVIQPLWRNIRKKTLLKERVISTIGKIFGKTEYPPIHPGIRKQIAPFFQEDNARLQKYLKRVQPIWPDWRI